MRYSMISPIKKFFQVTNHYMNQRQPFLGLLGGSYFFIMLMHLTNGIQRRKSICSNRLIRLKVAFNKLTYRILVDRIYSFGSHETSFVTPVLNSHHYGLFSWSTSPALAWFLASNKSIIHFNKIFQTINAVTVFHCSSDLSKHITGSRPGNINLFGQTQGRNSAFIRCSKIDSPKPFDQWQIGRMEQSSCCQRNMIFTLGTLICFSGSYIAGLFTSTAGTVKPFWPANFIKRFCTGFFGPIFFLPFKQGYTRHFHGILLV